MKLTNLRICSVPFALLIIFVIANVCAGVSVITEQNQDISGGACLVRSAVAESFTAPKSGSLEKISLYLEAETESAVGNGQIFTDEGNNPGKPIKTFGYNVKKAGWYDINSVSELKLEPGKRYWIVLFSSEKLKWYKPGKSNLTGRYRSNNKWYCGGLALAYKIWGNPNVNNSSCFDEKAQNEGPATSKVPVALERTDAFQNLEKTDVDHKSDNTANLVVNPGFEDDQTFKGWAVPNKFYFKTSLSPAARTGRRCAMLEDNLGVTWGYFQQKVAVKPGKYDVQAWCRLDGGYGFLWVQCLDTKSKAVWNERITLRSERMNTVVPDFVPAEYMIGDDKWHLVSIPVEVKAPAEFILVKLGTYFCPGRMYFDDVSIIKESK